MQKKWWDKLSKELEWKRAKLSASRYYNKAKKKSCCPLSATSFYCRCTFDFSCLAEGTKNHQKKNVRVGYFSWHLFYFDIIEKRERERRANRINTISFILPGSFITERWGEEIHGTFNCHFHSVQKTIANNCPPLFSIRPIQKIDRSQPTGKNVS